MLASSQDCLFASPILPAAQNYITILWIEFQLEAATSCFSAAINVLPELPKQPGTMSFHFYFISEFIILGYATMK
ncbi:hypothetical protein AAW31_07200 [Nitrosomonas communis]|uniref:Uncharacterized protein n=1 Tax=Nitrosomonas communis TaxID=44574 RepID=A0A0F7KFH3_9PROT|nr:hypothetical protein AAW31_07200 [Nitrosomonas communis]